MQAHELEAKVLGIVDRVVQGQPVEDSLIELKSGWIDAQKAARRIAGHANAAHGQPIIWIIGVDEKGKRVVGATKTDLADWYPQVSSCFDEVTPDLLLDLTVHYEELAVVALLLNTSRAPYVVKVPSGQVVNREVPWRQGTRVDSARHQDLIRILSPMQAYPRIEVLSARLTVLEPGRLRMPSASLGNLDVQVLIAPRGGTPLAFPFHMASARIEHPSFANPVLLKNAEFKRIIPVTHAGARTDIGSTVVFSAHVAQFHGAEAVEVKWEIPNVKAGLGQLYEEKNIAATISLCTVDPEIEVQVALTLRGPLNGNRLHDWTLHQSDVRIHLTHGDDLLRSGSESYEE